jgi:hypothetical protein
MSDVPPDNDVEEIDSSTEAGQNSVKRPRFNRDSATAMSPVYTTANEFGRIDSILWRLIPHCSLIRYILYVRTV